MKQSTSLAILLVLPAALAVKLDPKPFKRLIPADVLRDFRDSCFASTQCKVYANQENWSLEPFCGQSKCASVGYVTIWCSLITQEGTGGQQYFFWSLCGRKQIVQKI